MEKRANAVLEAEKSSSAGGRSSEKRGAFGKFYSFVISNLLMILLMSGILIGAGALLVHYIYYIFLFLLHTITH